MKNSPQKEQHRDLVEAEGMAIAANMHGDVAATRDEQTLDAYCFPRSGEWLPDSIWVLGRACFGSVRT